MGKRAMTKPKTTPGQEPTRTGQGSPARPKVPRLPRGYGAMSEVRLDLDPRIDLTKPIYQQALDLEEADKTAAE